MPMATSFPSHGELLECRREGQIVAVHGRGSSNLGAVDMLLRAMAPIVAELEGTRWVVLGTTEGDVIMTPEAEAHMTAAAQMLPAKGRIAVAIVLPENSLAAIAQSPWRRGYAQAGCALKFFVDVDGALAWLEERLAEV